MLLGWQMLLAYNLLQGKASPHCSLTKVSQKLTWSCYKTITQSSHFISLGRQNKITIQFEVGSTRQKKGDHNVTNMDGLVTSTLGFLLLVLIAI